MPTGTVEIVADKSTLVAYPLELSDIQEHVTHLKERFMELGAAIREAAEVAEEAGDTDTADLFTAVSRHGGQGRVVHRGECRGRVDVASPGPGKGRPGDRAALFFSDCAVRQFPAGASLRSTVRKP